MGIMNKFNIFVGIVVLVSIGWIMNIIKLVGLIDDPLSVMILLRVIGIVAAPLGAILGFVPVQ